MTSIGSMAAIPACVVAVVLVFVCGGSILPVVRADPEIPFFYFGNDKVDHTEVSDPPSKGGGEGVPPYAYEKGVALPPYKVTSDGSETPDSAAFPPYVYLEDDTPSGGAVSPSEGAVSPSGDVAPSNGGVVPLSGEALPPPSPGTVLPSGSTISPSTSPSTLPPADRGSVPPTPLPPLEYKGPASSPDEPVIEDGSPAPATENSGGGGSKDERKAKRKREKAAWREAKKLRKEAKKKAKAEFKAKQKEEKAAREKRRRSHGKVR